MTILGMVFRVQRIFPNMERIMTKEQIMAPDYEIEREAILHIYIRELKPCKKLMLRLTMINGWISRLFLNIIEWGVQRLNERGLCS